MLRSGVRGFDPRSPFVYHLLCDTHPPLRPFKTGKSSHPQTTNWFLVRIYPQSTRNVKSTNLAFLPHLLYPVGYSLLLEQQPDLLAVGTPGRVVAVERHARFFERRQDGTRWESETEASSKT